MTKFKYERKNEKDSGRSSKMTPLCQWPVQSNITQPKARENMRLSKCWALLLLSSYSISAMYITFTLYIFCPIVANVKRAMNQSGFKATWCNRKRGKTCFCPNACHQHTPSTITGAIKFRVWI